MFPWKRQEALLGGGVLSRFTLLWQPQCWWANQHGRTCCALSTAFIWFAFAVHVVRSLFAHASLFSPVLCLLFVSCLGLLLFWIGPVLRSLCALEICSFAWDLLATHRASSLTVCQINVTPLASGFWVLIPWHPWPIHLIFLAKNTLIVFPRVFSKLSN